MHRRRFLGRAAGIAGALVLPAARAQWMPSNPYAATTDPAASNPIAPFSQLDPLIWIVTQGAVIRRGRVKLELPMLADNGNTVPLRVTVDNPMTANDYVKSIHLYSEKNPVRNMASFFLGPRAGRAEVLTRVRLAGSQHVLAVAALSDGSFWCDSAEIAVTISACYDESS